VGECLKWWYKPLRMIQFNMQMKDTLLMDPEKIAREVSDMAGNAVVINVSDSVIWYDTTQHDLKVNPWLPQGRDLIGELIDAFHKREIKVIARGYFMGFEEEVYYRHPDWARRAADGSPVQSGNERPGEWNRLYVPCPTSGYVMESGKTLLLEMFSRYDLDGAFVLGSTAMRGPCWCDRCKQAFRVKFGREMPDDPALLDPLWREEERLEAYREIYSEITRMKPDLMYHRYFWPFDLEINGMHLLPDNIDAVALSGNILCTEAQDVLSMGTAGLPEWNTPALRMKMGRTIEGYPPPVGIIHACPGMDWRHACMPEAEFLYWAAQVPANGGSYWTTFTGFCDTIPDKRFFRTIRTLNLMVKKIEDDMTSARSDCQVMLLSDGGIHVQGWAEALMCAHIDFDMLAEYQLSFERIRRYPVVIAPKNFRYPEGAGELFRAYCEQGGNLIIEGTQDRALEKVRELLPVEGTVVSSEDLAATYLRIEDPFLQEKIGDCPLVPLRGRVGFCHPKQGAETLASWVPPFASVSTAGFPPERASLPAEKTDIPLAVRSGCGKGSVLFLPYEPSRLIREYGLKDMFTMIGGYLDRMLGDRKEITLRAPARVMMTVFQKDNVRMIHLVNGIGQRPLQDTIPCRDLELAVRPGGRTVKSVVSRIAGQELPVRQADGSICITVPELGVWDMIRIEYQ